MGYSHLNEYSSLNVALYWIYHVFVREYISFHQILGDWLQTSWILVSYVKGSKNWTYINAVGLVHYLYCIWPYIPWKKVICFTWLDFLSNERKSYSFEAVVNHLSFSIFNCSLNYIAAAIANNHWLFKVLEQATIPLLQASLLISSTYRTCFDTQLLRLDHWNTQTRQENRINFFFYFFWRDRIRSLDIAEF